MRISSKLLSILIEAMTHLADNLKEVFKGLCVCLSILVICLLMVSFLPISLIADFLYNISERYLNKETH